MGLSSRDARFVLSVAIQRGPLYDAPNGRFYVMQSASQSPAVAPTSTIFALLPDEPAGTTVGTPPESRGWRRLAIVCGGIAVAILGFGICGATTLGRNEPHVIVYTPSPTTSPATPPLTSAALDAEATATSAKLNAPGAPVPPRAHSGTKRPHHHHEHANSVG